MLNDGREIVKSLVGVKTASPCSVGGDGREGVSLLLVFSIHAISTVFKVLGTASLAITSTLFLCIVLMWFLREDFLAVAYSQS